MPELQYEDTELASLYDLFYPWDSRDDLPFYLPLVMSAASVLDVGCGTGALLKAAREAGHGGRLCGLDPAPGMLEQAVRRADVEWVHGDLSTVAFRDEFDLVVMTGHAFQVLVEDDAILAALAAIRGALTEQGRFAFETRNPRLREWEAWNEESIEGVTTDSGTVVLMRQQLESVEGDTVGVTITFDSSSWDGPMVSHSTLRFLDSDVLDSLLVDSGLLVFERFGDWDRRPLTHDSPEIITICGPGRYRPLPRSQREPATRSGVPDLG